MTRYKLSPKLKAWLCGFTRSSYVQNESTCLCLCGARSIALTIKRPHCVQYVLTRVTLTRGSDDNQCRVWTRCLYRSRNFRSITFLVIFEQEKRQVFHRACFLCNNQRFWRDTLDPRIWMTLTQIVVSILLSAKLAQERSWPHISDSVMAPREI